MTGEQIREYIENELGCDPVHDVDALACAIERVAVDIRKQTNRCVTHAQLRFSYIKRKRNY